MSPHANASRGGASDRELSLDVYQRALDAMAQFQGKELVDMPYLTLEKVLGFVSAALHVLTFHWPMLAPLRTAIDFTGLVISSVTNVRKRIAGLRLMQADMLCSLFSLRNFDKNGEQTVHGVPLPDRLHALCVEMKKDIQWIGNVMENYASENWLGRVLKEKGWKQAVTECSRLVNERKKVVQEVLQSYTAMRVDKIGTTVDQVATSIDHKVVPLLTDLAVDVKTIQRLFDPAKDEQKVLDAAFDLGGTQACLDDETKLQTLANLVPNDSGLEDSTKRVPKTSNEKPTLSAAELRRIKTPVEELLERNFKRFESKIEYLVEKTEREHRNMRSAITKLAGAQLYKRIEDPDIRKLWKDMQWGGSVDSRTFVLILYDYFIDLEHESRRQDQLKSLVVARSPATMLSPALTPVSAEGLVHVSPPTPTRSLEADSDPIEDEFKACTSPAGAAEDAWCLNYFNYRTLSSFLEVLDDNMNGLIKIKEVNDFTNAKPEELTLMKWIVYCAYGWQVSTHLYRVRLECIIQRIISKNYVKENSEAVAVYGGLLHWVTAFLHPLGEPDLDDQELLKVAHIVMKKREQAAQDALGILNYDVDTEDIRTMMDISMRSGVDAIIGRIEERMLPILFLIMQRHHALLSLGEKYIFSEGALERATRTIDCITDLLIDRVVHLREHFSKLQYDIDRKMQYFANGMFQEVHRYISASDKEERHRMITQWCRPWKSEFSIYWTIQEYDSEFQSQLGASAGYYPGASLSLKDLVRVASTISPGELDALAGYELVASYRKDYGIRMARFAIWQDFRGNGRVEEVKTSAEALHDGIQCDGCLTGPIMGPRFKCIDCQDFDYCSSCHEKFPPPLENRSDEDEEHTAVHRFLKVERPAMTIVIDSILSYLRTSDSHHGDTPHQLAKLNRPIEYCLSAPEEAVEKIARALTMFRDCCLEADADDADSKLEALNKIVTELAPLKVPWLADFAEPSRRLLVVQKEFSDSRPRHPGYSCNGPCAFGRNIYGERYKCIDCLDFDFCAECFPNSWNEHHNGGHRFILLRYPSARIVIQHLLARLDNHFDEDQLWKMTRQVEVEGESVKGESVGEEDVALVAAGPEVTEGSPQESQEAGDLSGRHRCALCQCALSKSPVYRCLSCTLSSRYNSMDHLLCSQCALGKVLHGDHKFTHILAVISGELKPQAADSDGETEHAPEVQASDTVTNEDISKRMDKMEETLGALLSMVGKLQGTVSEEPMEASAAVQV